MSKLIIPYYITQEISYIQDIYPDVLWFYTNDGQLASTSFLNAYTYRVIEYYFPTDPFATFNFPYIASAKLRIVANNTNYASAPLHIYTANSIKAQLRIQTENKIQAKLRIKTIGPAQAKLYIMTLRAFPRPQARIRIVANNISTPQAKLRIYIKSNKRKLSMPDYYAFYNIGTFGFLP